MSTSIVPELKKILVEQTGIRLAILFGSQVDGSAGRESDIDLALMGEGHLSAQTQMDLIARIAETFGRPVDLVDLKTAGNPCLERCSRACVSLVVILNTHSY